MTGGMICLFPDAPEELAVEGGDPPDQLHVTLAFVTKDAAQLPDDAGMAIFDAAEQGAEVRTDPLVLDVIGYCQIGDADPPAVALLVQSNADDALETGVGAIADAVRASLDDFGSEAFPPEHDSFIPHLTLGYGIPYEAAAMFVGRRITFGRGVSVTLGGETLDTPWGGHAESAEDVDPPEDTADAQEASVTTTAPRTPRAFARTRFEERGAAAEDAAPDPAPDAAPDPNIPVVGDDVTYIDPIDGTDKQGTVVEVLDPPADVEDPQPIVVVAPDDAPDERIEIPLSELEPVDPAEEGPIPEEEADVDEAPVPSAAAPVVRLASNGESFAIDDDGNWEGLLIPEGVESGDGRYIEPGALDWREFPLPLMCMFANPDGGEGHDGADIVGKIDGGERREDGTMWGWGTFDLESSFGREAHRLIEKKFLRGVSADLDAVEVIWENELDVEAELDEAMEFDPGLMIVTAGRIMGATLCPFPAFQEAFIALVGQTDDTGEIGVDGGGDPDSIDSEGGEVSDVAAAIAASAGGHETSTSPYAPVGLHARVFTQYETADGALVASAGNGGSMFPVSPPAAWFEKQTLAVGTPVRVSAEGQVSGYVAEWSNQHIGFDGRRVPPPRSKCAYAHFRKGQVMTAEGTLVATGPIVMDTVHPDLRLQASDAAAFYAHTGSAVADVAVYEDAVGIQIAGAVRPDASPEQVRAFRASDVSPDWRSVNGNPRECVAMLVVNNSGFKVGNALAAAAGHPQLALVAAGGPIPTRGVLDGRIARLALSRPVQPGRFSMATGGDGEVTALVAAGMTRKKPRIQERLAQVEAELAELRRAMAPVRRERATAALARLRSSKVTEPVDA